MREYTLKNDFGNDAQFDGECLWDAGDLGIGQRDPANPRPPALFRTKGGALVLWVAHDQGPGWAQRREVQVRRADPGVRHVDEEASLRGWIMRSVGTEYYGKSMLKALGLSTVDRIE